MASNASYAATGQSGPDEFEQLVELHYEPLCRFAMSLSRSETETADLVQETFATWAAKRGQVLDASKAKSWLFTTLYRHFLRGRRHDARNVPLEADMAETFTVEAAAIERLEASELLDMLHRIDPQFRSAVALFYLEDCSYLEIASILEVPIGTVKSRISRGLSQLKQLLTAETRKGERSAL